MGEIHLKIDGMHCDACIRRVTKAIESVPGAKAQDVAVGAARIEVTGDADAPLLVSALDRAGFAAQQAR